MKNYKYNYIFLLLLLMLNFAELSNAQQNFLHQVFQIENSQDSLKQFLKKNSLDSDSVLYAVLLPPMGCPRCEGLISPFFSKLKKIKPNLQTALFAFYPLPEAGYDYLKRRKFIVNNKFLITTDFFDTFFQYSTINLQVPIFIKINTKNGTLTNQQSSLGINLNDKTIEDFILINQTYFKKKTFNKVESENIPLKINLSKKNNYELNVLKFINSEKIISDKNNPISILSNVSVDESIMSSENDLTLSIFLFKKNGSEWLLKENVKPTKADNLKFKSNDVPDSVFTILEKMNLINSMFFSQQLDYPNLFFTASLPKVYWENIETEDLNYENQLVLISKNINTYKILYQELNHNDSILVDHTKSFFTSNGDVIMPISFGWPASGISDIPPNFNDFKKNPSNPKFYKEAYGLACFKDGKFLKYLNKLPDYYKDNKLGYTFLGYKFFENDNSLYIIERNLGICQVYDKESLNLVIEFSIPLIDTLNKPNSLNIFNMDYINSFKNVFSERISDFIVDKESIIYIVESGDNKYVRKFDIKTKSITDEIFIPNVYNDKKIKNAFIISGKNGISIGSICQDEKGSFLLTSEANIF